jgi:hypothetical protein
VNVTDGTSYDRAFRQFKVKGRAVFTIGADEISKILRILNSTPHNKDPEFPEPEKKMVTLCDAIQSVGYENTTVNFECCSSYGHDHKKCDKSNSQYFFNTPEVSITAIDLIVFMMKLGSQVICADFALKSLISNWDPRKFGAECPLEMLSNTEGNIRVRYGIEPCKRSVFPQLRALANLALPDESNASDVQVSSADMEAMGGTIVYGVKRVFDPNVSVAVLSVAVGKVVYRQPSAQPLTGHEESKMEDDLDFLPQPLVPCMTLCPDLVPPKPLTSDPCMTQCPDFLPLKPLEPEPCLTQCPDFLSQCNPMLGYGLGLNGIESIPFPFMGLQPQATMTSEPVRQVKPSKDTEVLVPFQEYAFFATADGTDLQGWPVHTVLQFKDFRGSLVVSSLHLSNLLQVNTNPYHLLKTATTVLGPSRSDEMGCELNEAIKSQNLELVKSVTATLVSEITSGSTSLYASV